jgi:hypothetical protein
MELPPPEHAYGKAIVRNGATVHQAIGHHLNLISLSLSLSLLPSSPSERSLPLYLPPSGSRPGSLSL